MGCETCGDVEAVVALPVVPEAGPSVADRQARSAMCRVCPRLRAGHVCGVSLRATEDHRVGGACPLGRFPDERGVVRWAPLWVLALGVRPWQWLGVPMPVRLVLLFKGLSRPEALEGCGCVRWVKVWGRWWGRRIERA